MKKLLLAGFWLWTMPISAAIIENDIYLVNFNERDATFSVTDKRNNYTWEPYKTYVCGFDVLNVEKIKNDSIRANVMRGSELYTISLTLAQNWIDIRISSPNLNQSMKSALVYPGPFSFDCEKGSLVIPSLTGVVVPMTDGVYKNSDFVVCGDHSNEVGAERGVFMPWMGLTDMQKGFLLLSMTPANAGYRMVTLPGQITGYNEPGSSFAGLSYPVFDRMGLERHFRLWFVTNGGYVSLCKVYREHCKKTGLLRTHAEKIKHNPEHKKIIGAPHIWLWHNARNGKFVDRLKAAGIEKAWIGQNVNEGPTAAIKVNVLEPVPNHMHPNYNAPPPDMAEATLRNNYLLAPYDGIEALQDPAHLAWVRAYCPDLWPLEKGALQYRNLVEKGYNSFGVRLCPAFYPMVAKPRIDVEPGAIGYNCWFYDVTATRAMHECWNPNHRISREQDLEKRNEMFHYAYEKANIVIGSEDGADWAIKYCGYFQGGMTFQYFYGPGANSADLQNPYAIGKWDDRERPTHMLKNNKPTEMYQKKGLGYDNRVPLMELVFGDCAIWTFRWEDANSKSTEAWHKKNLFCMLYGEPSMWNMTDDIFEERKDKFIKSYHDVDRWSEKVKLSELVNHEHLTADKTVHKSTWANGNYIIVNFSEFKPYDAKGIHVEPMGFYKGKR